MTIRARAAVIAGASAAIIGGVGLIAFRADREVQQTLVRIESESVPTIDALHTLRFTALRMVSSTSEYALVQTERRRRSGAAAVVGAPSEPDTDEVALRDAAATAFTNTLASLESRFADLAPDLSRRVEAQGRDLIDASRRVLDAVDAGADSAPVLAEKARLEVAEHRLLDALEGALAEHAGLVPLQTSQARATLERLARQGMLLATAAAAAVAGLVLLLGLWLASALERLVAAGRVPAGGDAHRGPPEIQRAVAAIAHLSSETRRLQAACSAADAFVAALPAPIVATDSRFTVTRVNPAALALLGATDAHQVIGRRLAELGGDMAGPAQAAATSGHPVTFETTVVQRTGAPVAVAASMAPWAADGVRGVVCVLHDMRDRLEAERLLVEARDRAQAADRAKSEFLATMSHQLRGPLDAIIGYSQMLQENEPPPDALADLERIEAAGAQLRVTVDRVQELASAEAGHAVLTLEPFPVAALVAEVRSETEPLAARRGNRLGIHVPPDAGSMVADRVKLRRVLTNLLANACKFTEGGTVSLSVKRLDAGGQPWVAFEVNDTGCGMSHEQMTTLFTPFAAANGESGADGRRYGGSGLGLALAHRFCRMMSGTIDVSSAPGRGSCFTVQLPLVVPSLDLAA